MNGNAIALVRLDTRLELLQQSQSRYDGDVKTLCSRLFQTAISPGQRTSWTGWTACETTSMSGWSRHVLRCGSCWWRPREEQKRVVVQVSIVVTLLAGLLDLGLAAAMTLALSRPVKRLLAGTQAVEAGALDIEIPVTSSDEIGRLAAAFNHMVGELRTKARIRDTFGRYLDPRIVEEPIDRPALTALEGERRVMTVFFCDMKGVSALGESLTPKNLPETISMQRLRLLLATDPHRLCWPMSTGGQDTRRPPIGTGPGGFRRSDAAPPYIIKA